MATPVRQISAPTPMPDAQARSLVPQTGPVQIQGMNPQDYISKTIQDSLSKISPSVSPIPQIGERFDPTAASQWRGITESQIGTTKATKDKLLNIQNQLVNTITRGQQDFSQAGGKFARQMAGQLGGGIRGGVYAGAEAERTQDFVRALQDVIAGGAGSIDEALQKFTESEAGAKRQYEDVLSDAAQRAEAAALKKAQDEANRKAIEASNKRINELTNQISNITKQIQSQPRPTPTGQIQPPPPPPPPPPKPPALPPPRPAGGTDPYGRPPRPGQQPPDIRALQNVLKADGFDPGPLDGRWGPKTEAAYRQWLQMSGADPNVPLDSGRVHEIFVWNRPTGGQPTGGQVGGGLQARRFQT